MRIYIHKSGVMHSILRHLGSGYIFHTTGIVPPQKIEAVVSKLRTKYDTGISKYARKYRKQQGRGNAALFVYPTADGLAFQFFLLLTSGAHSMRQSERLKDATKQGQRLVFDGRYEAILLPRKGGKVAWTWRLTTQSYTDVKATLFEIIRVKKSRSAFKDTIALLERMPGFRGIRQQVGFLRDNAVTDWMRIHRDNSRMSLVARSGYLRYQKYPEVALHLVVERMLAGKKPIANSWRYTNDYGDEQRVTSGKGTNAN